MIRYLFFPIVDSFPQMSPLLALLRTTRWSCFWIVDALKPLHRPSDVGEGYPGAPEFDLGHVLFKKRLDKTYGRYYTKGIHFVADIGEVRLASSSRG